MELLDLSRMLIVAHYLDVCIDLSKISYLLSLEFCLLDYGATHRSLDDAGSGCESNVRAHLLQAGPSRYVDHAHYLLDVYMQIPTCREIRPKDKQRRNVDVY